MFDELSSRFEDAVKGLRGEAKISENNINDALNQVKRALLDADVSLSVVKEFISDVKDKAIGEEVVRGVNPGQKFIEVVNKELINIMGKENSPLNENKNSYLAGKSKINLSKVALEGLIKRTMEQRDRDIKKGIYRVINSQILKIDLESQTSSRIVVLVELNYLEKIIKNSGEFINETSLTPLRVKYILGFSNKSWKLADFVSGL